MTLAHRLVKAAGRVDSGPQGGMNTVLSLDDGPAFVDPGEAGFHNCDRMLAESAPTSRGGTEATEGGASMPSKAMKRAGGLAALGWAVAAFVCFTGSAPAFAQGWSWPWEAPSQQRPPPVPPAPVYRQPGQPGYPGQPGQPSPPMYPGAPQPSQNSYGSQGWQPPAGNQPPPAYQPPGAPRPGQQPSFASNRPPICLQLEQRLAQEVNRGNLGRDALPKLEADIRQADLAARQAENQLERGGCYEYFLFVKSLKQTRACIDQSRQYEDLKRRVTDLDVQRQQIVSGSGRSLQDDIVRELARNGCGQGYQQEASRSNNPFSSIWQDSESSGGVGTRFGALPFATYRTICVRLCDGYYFPVSFSTLPNHFDKDSDVCQSKCAAPAELYYYQNPGGVVDQAVSVKTNQAYTALRTAFRFRKEYIQGCSCKQAEYSPAPGAPGQPQDRRADAVPAPVPAKAPR